MCMHDARVYMSAMFRVGILCLIIGMGVSGMMAQQQHAGTTIGTATQIIDTVTLRVQSGMNYIRIEPNHLPATIVYMPDTAFGPFPTAMMDDTLQAETFFEDCLMGWRWTIPASEESARVAISAHESASITAMPTIITYFNTIVEQACDSFLVGDRKFTESGDYNLDTTIAPNGDRYINVLSLTIHYTVHRAEKHEACVSYEGPSGKIYTESGIYEDSVLLKTGCYQITTLDLTIEPYCTTYDTIYFCAGFNTEHEEKANMGLVHRYRPYEFESPADWDYMEGVILDRQPERFLADLALAENNLRAHSQDRLVPRETISWSIRYNDADAYVPVTVEPAPQWIDAGHLALQVQFLCGEIYNNEYPMALDETFAAQAAIKRIENGQVIILRGGERYTVLGTKIE